MRTPIIIANWKMYKTIAEAEKFVTSLLQYDLLAEREIVICGSYTLLYTLQRSLCGYQNREFGAQNVHWEAEGAFTGEVSVEMLRDLMCPYVIIGHSERRQYFNETDSTVNKKVQAAVSGKLTPIICVGESLEQRKSGDTLQHIQKQLAIGLKGILPEEVDDLIIAYEPIWAIGTGETATAEQAQEVHTAIRNIVGEKTRIVYGGSVKPNTMSVLMKQPDIDGVLVGGASLEVDSFVEIVNYI